MSFEMRKKEMEGINIEDYVTVYPGTTTRYINWRLQQQLFYSIYPNGSIVVSAPEPDPLKTPDTWVATCRVYTEKTDEREAVCVTARRSPSSEEIITDGEYIDPYKLCQISAIGDALSALGFAAPIMTNAEKESYMKDSLMIPAENGEVMETETSKTETSAEAPTEEPPKKPRKRRTKAEMEAARKAEEAKKATEKSKKEKPEEPADVGSSANIEVKTAEETTTGDSSQPVASVNSKEKTEQNTQPEEISVNQEESSVDANTAAFASIEDARAVKCTYRNFNKYTIGEIMDQTSNGDRAATSYVEWATKSSVAARKCPQEVAAIKYLQAQA